MKHTLWKWKFLTFLLLILFSCQKDELLKNENEPHQHIGESSTKIVSAEDIPKVMDFLKKKTNGRDGFEIRLSMEEGMQQKSSEPDLVFAELVTDNVMAYTNEAGITNYSFQMSFENEPEFENEVSFFNLIVKEINTEEGFYSYIHEYRADKEWFLNSGLFLDMQTYTGKMIFYTLEGLYVAKAAYTGGENIDYHLSSPCPDPDDPTNGDPGSGGNSGPGPGGGGIGPAGGDPEITFVWVCNWRNEKHSGPSACNNPGMGGSWVIELVMPPQIMAGCDPAPEPCFDQYNDPCTLGCNSEGECIEENDGTIINIATKPCEKLNVISQNQDFMDNINELNTASNNTTVGTRREKGYIYEGSVTTDNTTFVESQPDEPYFSIPSQIMSAFIHNHFFINETNATGEKIQSINVPSDADIVALYILAKNNLIQQQFLGFPFIVVYQDNMYHLEITSLADFIALGDLGFLNEDGSMSSLLADEFIKNSIKHENSANTNMNNLAKLLDNGNLGIELYQSPVNNPNWRKVKVNSDNTVSLEDCN